MVRCFTDKAQCLALVELFSAVDNEWENLYRRGLSYLNLDIKMIVGRLVFVE